MSSSSSRRHRPSISPFRSRMSPAAMPSGRLPAQPVDHTDKAKENVTVTVRFRPLSGREINKGDCDADGEYTVRNEYNASIGYGFDRLFGPATTTRCVYDVVNGAMQGINANMRLVHFLFLICIFALLATSDAVHGTDGYYKDHEVISLPDQPPIHFKQYSGDIPLLPHKGQKSMFYWFFEASTEAAEKPLVLWLQGGPGFSSIGVGALQENGPFHINANGSLTLNQHSWNEVANMLCLESPVGVGFSYSNHSGDYDVLGDRVTAEDTYDFLLNWLTRFPVFKSRDFYIAGENYAGHFAPQLAEVIWEGNRRADRETYINLKGFMIGNPLLNEATDDTGIAEFAWASGLISDQFHSKLVRCLPTRKGCSLEDMDALIDVFYRVNSLGVYAPVCSGVVSVPSKGPDPCTGLYATKYLNRADVQRALHANTTKLSFPYMIYRDGTTFKWIDQVDTVLPVLKKLLDSGLPIWIYSGDTDARIPLASTRLSINKLNLPVEEEWRVWFGTDRKSNSQLAAGYVETYEGGLALATVLGAGHQVPSFAPHRALVLFRHFLSDTRLPYYPRT